MITVDNLTKSFRKNRGEESLVVDHASFECGPGEVFGIIGSNGAGKTTLMRMLATIVPPTSGYACVAGFEIGRYPEAVRGNIGFVSPSHGLYDTMTVHEFLRYFGLLNGISKHEIGEIVDEVIEWLKITEYAGMKCKKLSTGIRQRVSIARAVVHQPPVLLLDEPTNGLDVESTRIVLDFIRSCRDEGQAVIFSTHIMDQAEEVCDRIALMHRGRILAIGTLAELSARTGAKRLADILARITEPIDARSAK